MFFSAVSKEPVTISEIFVSISKESGVEDCKNISQILNKLNLNLCVIVNPLNAMYFTKKLKLHGDGVHLAMRP